MKGISDPGERKKLYARFHAALYNWASNNSGSVEERKQLQKAVNVGFTKWTKYGSLEDWRDEYFRHPEWNSALTRKEGKQRHNFRTAFVRWVRKQTNEEESQRLLLLEYESWRNGNADHVSSEEADRWAEELLATR